MTPSHERIDRPTFTCALRFVSPRGTKIANSRPPMENYSKLCTTTICYGVNVDFIVVFFRTVNGLRIARRRELVVF